MKKTTGKFLPLKDVTYVSPCKPFHAHSRDPFNVSSPTFGGGQKTFLWIILEGVPVVAATSEVQFIC